MRQAISAIPLLLLATWTMPAQSLDVAQRLQGFDDYMAQTLKDWNAPGVGVGIVVGDKLVFAKGYGYRDYGKKLPYTADTMSPIASNTKLFTAVAAGMLVEEGKLTWDKPVRDSVPSIRFYNDELNSTVTLRDMLSHRTGITRHDSIWFKSDFSRRQLFEKVVDLEPQQPLRTTFLYNNLMFAAVGYLIELQSGKPWEQFVRERILQPLGMSATGYTIADMLKQPEFGVGYTEKRDSFELYRIPYYEDIQGVAPCGAIVSNIENMSHWLIALMNNGRYQGRQVLPPEVLKATLEPATPLPNANLEARGWSEILNAAYGMGRYTASYRGHLLTYHGGDLPGFHTQVSFMPQDHVGVIVFEIGNHSQPLYNIVTYNVYERLLGMSLTPWSERALKIRLADKKAGAAARAKADTGRIPNTEPSHPLAAYAGTYENPAYGLMTIALKDNQLQFDFHKVRLPLVHYHYDRFDTPDDEENGKWSVNFRTNPQGDIEQAAMSLDEAEAVFTRKPDAIDPALLTQLAGVYERPDGSHFQIEVSPDGKLWFLNPGATPGPMLQVKGLVFRNPHFSDRTWEFVVEAGKVRGVKQRSPGGEYTYPKR